MKKIIISILIVFTICLTSEAAKYKVNTKGSVTSGNKQIQAPVNQNPLNNYYAQPYVNTKQALQGGVGTIDIVMDYSGSMLNWIDAAKIYMSAIIAQLPESVQTGFRVFGNNGGNNPYTPIMGKVKNIVKKDNGKYKVKSATSSYLGSTSGSCSATTQVASVASNNADAIRNGMYSAQIGGSTPLTLALEQAVEIDFASIPQNKPKKIILITDGGENCGGDPCAFAKELMKKRSDIVIDVVLVSSSSSGLYCVANTTGGKIYNPVDVPGFMNVLTKSINEGPTPVQTQVPVQKSEPQQQYEFVKD